MPLTPFQKEVLAILAANRSEESHFAGGVVLNALDDSPRSSYDFDIFHELATEVARASSRDVESLRRAGFTVETPSRYGEWEKESPFRKAKVSRDTESVEMDWGAGPRSTAWTCRQGYLGARTLPQHRLAFGVATEQAGFINPSSRFLSLWERTEVRVRLRYTPVQFGSQPHSALLDKLLFGVGVGAHWRT